MAYLLVRVLVSTAFLVGVSGLSSTSTSASASTQGMTWPRPVYIRSMGAFLPNEAVSNQDIGKHIGELEGKFSEKIRQQILEANGIKKRYYATQNGRATHLGLDLAVQAVKNALDNSHSVDLDSIGMLATGSTMPDVLVPGFANLLHGKLNAQTSMDCLSSSGVCISSTLGEHGRALVVGTEVMSHFMYASRFQEWAKQTTTTTVVDDNKNKNNGGGGGGGNINVRQQFNVEFLRYMLSDGSGCAVLDTVPHPIKLSYRIEGFYHHSFAHLDDPCMVVGCHQPGDPITVGQTWKTRQSAFANQQDEQHQADQTNVFQPLVMAQDVKLLNKKIIKWHEQGLKAAKEAGLVENVDWFFPHISSHVFYKDVVDQAERIAGVPQDHVWTNLAWVGNVGSASAFLLLWGALNEVEDTKVDKESGETKPDVKVGDRILVSVPESGQFSFHFFLVTVVDHNG